MHEKEKLYSEEEIRIGDHFSLRRWNIPLFSRDKKKKIYDFIIER